MKPLNLEMIKVELRMKVIVTLLFLLMISPVTAQSSTLQLAKAGKSSYQILVPENASPYEKKAAEVLQHYFKKVTGAKLPITSNHSEKKYISIGKTPLSNGIFTDEGFEITSSDESIFLRGKDRNVLFATYHFIEEFLKCRKWAPNEKAECPKIRTIEVPATLIISEKLSLVYREVYSTAILDEEYRDWHKLHHLDELWGLWGHSYFKLILPQLFQSNPDLFSYFKGKRRPLQLCLSNEEVFERSVKKLEELFDNDPGKKYWSISPNDGVGHCECDECTLVDQEEGGPQGSLIRFVNKIAEKYPDRTFTTLAYGATATPTLKTPPRENVTIFLSNIEIDRNEPVRTERSAENFRANLEGWLQLTPNVFVWDYATQFTNYLAPFPDYFKWEDNIDFYRQKGVKGLFVQMGGENHVDNNALKTHLLSQRLWNNKSGKDETEQFLNGYYKNSAAYVRKYLSQLTENLKKSNSKLDIYGNPINEFDSYLSPSNIVLYNSILDDAEREAEDKTILNRIRRLRLGPDFTSLQQAKFFGRENHGIFGPDNKGKWVVKRDIKKKVHSFIHHARRNNIKQLSEGGQSLEEYEAEWKTIFKKGAPDNLSIGAQIQYSQPWVPDYPAKQDRTLIDGMYGLDDFSYNWLLFDESHTVTIDLQKEIDVKTISPTLLQDQRHWIFLPQNVELSVSLDGNKYESIGVRKLSLEEDLEVKTQEVLFEVLKKIRFLKLKFQSLDSMPEWRSHPSKKPLMAIDEIWVK